MLSRVGEGGRGFGAGPGEEGPSEAAKSRAIAVAT